ncbi:MAG TPA: hypothetical protein VMV19_20810 [Xanthobacteraceae bacterium]|nr:hypothetical protein [Xanthobacteraceae bacterium]
MHSKGRIASWHPAEGRGPTAVNGNGQGTAGPPAGLPASLAAICLQQCTPLAR